MFIIRSIYVDDFPARSNTLRYSQGLLVKIITPATEKFDSTRDENEYSK